MVKNKKSYKGGKIMVTKLIRCPHCKKLTFIRFENSKIVTCKKVIDNDEQPYYKRES
jgi:ribosomal protein L37AE/L43A